MLKIEFYPNHCLHSLRSTFNVVDGTPIPFAKFIDTYAMKLGYGQPAHIPLFTAPVAKVIIKEPQMEILDRSTTVNSDRFREQLN